MKIIVILRLNPDATVEALGPHFQAEERQLWRYLTSGQCRAVHYNIAQFGSVVLEFEAADQAECERLVTAFPLVAAGLLAPEYLPLSPYTGLAHLFAPDHRLTPDLPAAWTGPTA